ncbi:uncharacterized protein TNCV_895971 [Trichonephila clavipes]|nr:uncharacterized protein TNCV_895971 [Trichonephila clavipes]
MKGHKSECDINHLGSSTSMEMEAALTLWKRSTSLGFRYITVLSDGDCKRLTTCARKSVWTRHCDKKKKEECINHVSKAVRTAFEIYCKRLSCSSISTDAKPQHSKCPAGENSWCFYQSAIANGEKPNNHKLNVGTPINEKVSSKDSTDLSKTCI